MSGCTNTWRILDGWRQEECEEHGFLKGSGGCVCPEPFHLFPFPDRKKGERRRAWAQNVKGESGILFITLMSHKCNLFHFSDFIKTSSVNYFIRRVACNQPAY